MFPSPKMCTHWRKHTPGSSYQPARASLCLSQGGTSYRVRTSACPCHGDAEWLAACRMIMIMMMMAVMVWAGSNWLLGFEIKGNFLARISTWQPDAPEVCFLIDSKRIAAGAVYLQAAVERFAPATRPAVVGYSFDPFIFIFHLGSVRYHFLPKAKCKYLKMVNMWHGQIS